MPALILSQRYRHSGVRSDHTVWVLLAAGTELGPVVVLCSHSFHIPVQPSAVSSVVDYLGEGDIAAVCLIAWILRGYCKGEVLFSGEFRTDQYLLYGVISRRV